MQMIFPATLFARWFDGNRCQTNTVRRHTLERRETLASSFRIAGRIHCVTGLLWITRDMDREDILLRGGESFTCHRHDRVVIEALENAVLEMTGN